MGRPRNPSPRHSFLIPLGILLFAADGGLGPLAAPPTFATKRLINTVVPGLLPFDVRTEDIDQDGDLDVYTANYSGRISWFENDGAHPPGPFTEHILTEFADGVEATVAVRIDPDGDIDFFSAAFNRDEIAWYDNGGGGTTWTLKPITLDVPLAVDVWAADLDGDGDNDAISASGSDGRIAWFENAGGFDNFWTMRIVPGATAGSVEAADVDQDGDLDIVAGATWCESDGGAPPAFTAHSFTGAPAFADAIAVLDVDRDGDPDVVTAGQEDDRITWYENDGGLPVGWTKRVVTATADFATGVSGADLDGDGDVDLLSSSFFDNTIAWYENDGATPPGWTKRAISTTAMGARSVFAADLDADGDMDVLSASQSDQKVVWHVNDADFVDADHDGVRDGLDCAPVDATAFRVPRDVSGVRFRSQGLLDWNSAVPGSGSGARYGVARGTLRPYPLGPGPADTVLADGAPAREVTDAATPAPGTAFYYLVKASNACGSGP